VPQFVLIFLSVLSLILFRVLVQIQLPEVLSVLLSNPVGSAFCIPQIPTRPIFGYPSGFL